MADVNFGVRPILGYDSKNLKSSLDFRTDEGALTDLYRARRGGLQYGLDGFVTLQPDSSLFAFRFLAGLNGVSATNTTATNLIGPSYVPSATTCNELFEGACPESSATAEQLHNQVGLNRVQLHALVSAGLVSRKFEAMLELGIEQDIYGRYAQMPIADNGGDPLDALTGINSGTSFLLRGSLAYNLSDRLQLGVLPEFSAGAVQTDAGKITGTTGGGISLFGTVRFGNSGSDAALPPDRGTVRDLQEEANDAANDLYRSMQSMTTTGGEYLLQCIEEKYATTIVGAKGTMESDFRGMVYAGQLTSPAGARYYFVSPEGGPIEDTTAGTYAKLETYAAQCPVE